MTIERQWIEIMKVEVPDAFSDDIAFVPEAGFIDAQIKLMAMPHECDWDTFLMRQFVMPVRQMFGLGARTVILAFDDYENVPRAKAITQAKRRARLVPIEFNEEQELPAEPPVPWDAAMANRVFKAKVVAWVTQALPGRLALSEGTKLVIDWRGASEEHWAAHEGAVIKEVRPRRQVGKFALCPWYLRIGLPSSSQTSGCSWSYPSSLRGPWRFPSTSPSRSG